MRSPFDNPVAQLQNIWAGYANARASDRPCILKDFSLTLSRQEWVGLEGPHGAGKTTLLQLLAGSLLQRSLCLYAGRIWLGNSRLDKLSPQALLKLTQKHVVLVPQSPQVFNPTRTMESQFRFLLKDAKCHNVTLREVKKRVAELGLESKTWKQYPFELSGGMLQRFSLVAGFMSSPTLLLLDEPVSFCDATSVERVVKVLQQWHRTCFTTVVVSSHNAGFLNKLHCRLVSVVASHDGGP